ncbi:MAG TPA: NAD(P)-dependent oxidoreductase [Myxococcota bacterium]|nr:NAD(P)-dependent oxidoreductase [Myxococcota bacterium]
MAKVAFLGTGLIGRAMAERALEQGHEVSVYNRTASKSAPLAALGARVCATPREAVRGAERVHLVLSDDASVDQVLAAVGEGGEVGDTVLVDHTTTSPAGARARAERRPNYLHAPIFMSPTNARAGLGLILASGRPALFSRVEAALQVMTGRVVWLGERPDLAASYKLFGNATIIALTGAVADVLTMGRALGLEPHEAMGIYELFDASMTLKFRGQNMAKGNFTPGFELTMARKDVRLMMDAADGLPLAVLPGIAARMDALIEAGHGQADMGVLAVGAVEPAAAPSGDVKAR